MNISAAIAEAAPVNSTIPLVELGAVAVVTVALDAVELEMAVPRTREPPVGPPGGATLALVAAARATKASRVLPVGGLPRGC